VTPRRLPRPGPVPRGACTARSARAVRALLGSTGALAAALSLSGCIIRFFPLPNYCDETPVIGAAGGTFTGETRGNNSRTGPVSCLGGLPSPEDVYTLELDADASVHLDTAGSDFDTILYLRSDCESIDPSDEVACNDDAALAGPMQRWSSLDMQLTAGTYFVFVDGFNGVRGNYVLNAVVAPPDQPAGDQCPNAATAVEGDTAASTATFVDDTAASCGGDGAPDAFFTLVLINDTAVVVETTAADFDTVLSVRASCLETASEIACDDDGSPAGMGLSRLDLGVLAAGAYTVIVDGATAGAAGGAYTLRITEN
jgi:hypothetical protein